MVSSYMMSLALAKLRRSLFLTGK